MPLGIDTHARTHARTPARPPARTHAHARTRTVFALLTAFACLDDYARAPSLSPNVVPENRARMNSGVRWVAGMPTSQHTLGLRQLNGQRYQSLIIVTAAISAANNSNNIDGASTRSCHSNDSNDDSSSSYDRRNSSLATLTALTDHNYMAHNYIRRSYMGHNYIGHDYTGHAKLI